MEADSYRGLFDYSVRVYNRLCGQPVAGLGGMGLQQDAGQRPRADMPTIHPAVAASESGRDCLG